MTFEFAFFNKIKRDKFWRIRRKGPDSCGEVSKYSQLYSRASLMVWEEHCVECSPPDCYRTCLLYEQGVTVDCRRFTYGIFRDNKCRGLLGYGAEISFKRWAKLESVYNATLIPLRNLKVLECGYQCLVWLVKMSSYLRYFFFKRHTYPRFKILQTSFFIALNRINTKKLSKISYPDFFVLDVINLEEFSLDIKISFTQKTAEENLKYDEIIKLEPGLNKHAIDYNKIVLALGDVYECLIEITIVNDQEAVLKFTALDFVKINDKKLKADSCHEVKNTDKSKPKVKCLVFDLDNTLWDGTLITDGLSGINLRSIVIDTIRKLDKRGILFSIASKNNFKDAQKVLSGIKMHEYFLCPQIHWGLKSESIKRIAKELDIGTDTIAFIDDSSFELAEVSSALPEVRCYHANEMGSLLNYAEFNVTVTQDSANRRAYYRTKQNFERNEKVWKKERLDFLKNCQMVISISKPSGVQIDRCYELLQRTNQLNLSARQYTREEFMNFISDNIFECFVLGFKDKFGEYGIIGVAVVQIDNSSPKLIELAISCRVARRKVEQSFICWLAKRYAGRGLVDFMVQMCATNRNGLLAQAFEELNFKRNDISEILIEWVILLNKPLPEQKVISIIEQ